MIKKCLIAEKTYIRNADKVVELITERFKGIFKPYYTLSSPDVANMFEVYVDKVTDYQANMLTEYARGIIDTMNSIE